MQDIHSPISISRSCGDYFYKFELPEVQINLHFGLFRLIKRDSITMIRFEKAFLIEIDYSKKARVRMNSIFPSSRYKSLPVISLKEVREMMTRVKEQLSPEPDEQLNLLTIESVSWLKGNILYF